MNSLQMVAAEYASHGLAVIPTLPKSKVSAVHWKTFQVDPPSDIEREAMFSESGLNIGVVCGSVSGNLAMIDAETSRAFDLQYERCHRAGLTNTWIDRSPSGGGHIWLRLPFAVRSRGKIDDVEVLAQDKYGLAPPSIAVSKVDGSLRPYEFASRAAQIISVESLDQVHWLNLERASLHLPFRAFPRKAQRLLKGESCDRYITRSEAEQAIVTVLVNSGYSFEEILSAFRNNPAAGKFATLSHKDPDHAVDYLRHSYNRARSWCVNQSAARHIAIELLDFANSIPWPGRSGSSRRAVFIAHAGLSYRSGQPTYHASTRDLAELAGCDHHTASRATAHLCAAGFVELRQQSAYTFARRFALPDRGTLQTKTKLRPLTTTTFEGVGQVSSFSLPEAFRARGLGRAAYEVLQAFHVGSLTCAQLAEKTGRHVQTIRKALKVLKRHGLVTKTGRMWRGRAIEDIDLEQLSRALGMKGAAMHQRERHNADRLRHRLRHKIQQTQETEVTHER
jgi:DNA-binding transcriptional regulator YhcF (GntR family)